MPGGDRARPVGFELGDLDAQRLLVLAGDARRAPEHFDQLLAVGRDPAQDPRELAERLAVAVVVVDDLAPRIDRTGAVPGALGQLRDLGECLALLDDIGDDPAALAQRIGERRVVALLAQDLDQRIERVEGTGLEDERITQRDDRLARLAEPGNGCNCARKTSSATWTSGSRDVASTEWTIAPSRSAVSRHWPKRSASRSISEIA